LPRILTLRDDEFQMMRSAAIHIIRALDVQGGCNIQFAFKDGDYRVIEVNPRVSRSSALASKATGYPIARVAAKIAVGLHLDEIKNSVTGCTAASFEPTIDYVVVKVPRWPFDKFKGADRTLTTSMKSTGEVMAIGRTLEEAFIKAKRSIDTDVRIHTSPSENPHDPLTAHRRAVPLSLRCIPAGLFPGRDCAPYFDCAVLFGEDQKHRGP